ncbi:APC family permease [Parafilimonas terrae]|jgi:APA family basic amino acid/polyamine antiporter|uniref:Basic amino acid/polyamine antiporter, APA family n=1 Tax=Parafilimonas terrae TaxID=1465490 RepID=A0A1I5Y429_9BACT|nr:amino acid permease [Parafilimonas terrae]SFQ38948.1 basic amino acid/polyamine antiporter, APA family [Parafilimonas terrae]
MSSPKLNRSLGLQLVIVLVIGNIIGSGVYKKVAPMTAELHSSGWVLICWVLAGIISLFGALCNAEVAGLLADTGGEYSYYQKIYNKFFAFLFGWSLFAVIQTAAISALAYVFAESLNSVVHFPELLPSMADVSIGGVFYPFADLSVKLVAILLIILLTWLNSLGIKAGAEVSMGILILVFGSIFTIIVFGLASDVADTGRISMAVDNNTPVTVSAVFTAMLAAFWGYQGWASAGYVGGEIKDAKRNLPRGIVIGIITIIILYQLVNATYLSLLSIPELDDIYKAGNKIAAIEAVRNFWGDNGVLFISVLIVITTLGCCNATILSSCRTYFAMANEGLFFKGVAKLNNKQAPVNSLWVQGVWACILVLSGTFDQLTDMIIFAVFIFYGATTLGVFILRKKMPDAPRPYKVWGYPIVPAIVVIFCAVLIVNTVFSRPREAAIGAALMLTGVPFYYWFKRNNSTVTGKD